MAKRKRVAAPSDDDMSRIEEEFRRETPLRPERSMAPIAQVAGQAAAGAQTQTAEVRQVQARDRADAERLRRAEADGQLMVDLPLDRIEGDALVRDRTVLDAAEMDELKKSIMSHGMRLPIEVFARGDGESYGLISGYRRLRAVRDIYTATGLDKFATIRAVIRDPEAMGGAIVAMVEENEVRAALSHYERGRIAVISAQQGSFTNTEEAVNTLFAAASKAKRSKIRSFALIYEELGDMLEYAELLREKDGLRLANALRQGAEPKLREALALGQGAQGEEEWALMEPVVGGFEAPDAPRPKGGRPRRKPPATGWTNTGDLHLSNGIVLKHITDNKTHFIRLTGKGIDSEIVQSAMIELQRLLERPK